jgi:hypothetical protein
LASRQTTSRYLIGCVALPEKYGVDENGTISDYPEKAGVSLRTPESAEGAAASRMSEQRTDRLRAVGQPNLSRLTLIALNVQKCPFKTWSAGGPEHCLSWM